MHNSVVDDVHDDNKTNSEWHAKRMKEETQTNERNMMNLCNFVGVRLVQHFVNLNIGNYRRSVFLRSAATPKSMSKSECHVRNAINRSQCICFASLLPLCWIVQVVTGLLDCPTIWSMRGEQEQTSIHCIMRWNWVERGKPELRSSSVHANLLYFFFRSSLKNFVHFSFIHFIFE